MNYFFLKCFRANSTINSKHIFYKSEVYENLIGEPRLDKKKDSGERAACEYPLELVHLKKFVQVSEGTGFCVDTENAAV